MKTIYTLALLFWILLPHQSNSQHRLYNDSNIKLKFNSVKTVLRIEPVKVYTNAYVPIDSNNVEAFGIAAVAAILPVAIETGINVVKTQLKKREESYSGEYSVKASQSGFWAPNNLVQLPKLTLERKVKENKASTEKEALKIILIPEQSEDGTAFRYKLDSIKLNYSEARANKKNSSMDMEVDIKFTAFMKDGEKNTKSELGQNSITIEGVEFGRSINEPEYTGWFPILPNTNSNKANGNYEFLVTVKEANPGVLRTKKIKQFFDDNGETILESTKVIIQNVIKEDKKETTDALAGQLKADRMENNINKTKANNSMKATRKVSH